MLSEHRQPEHSHEKISDIEEQQKEDLKSLVTESKSKVSICQEATSNLENALSELQIQRDNAKGLIQETFQSCKAVLEKRKVSWCDWLNVSSIDFDLSIDLLGLFVNISSFDTILYTFIWSQ